MSRRALPIMSRRAHAIMSPRAESRGRQPHGVIASPKAKRTHVTPSGVEGADVTLFTIAVQRLMQSVSSDAMPLQHGRRGHSALSASRITRTQDEVISLQHPYLRTMFPLSFLRKRRRQAEMLAFHKAFVRPGDLCFDIGAHTGERTQVMRQLGARVVAVEPQQSCFDQLRRAFAADKQVTLLRAAAGAQAGTATLHLCDEEAECSTLSADFMRVYGQRSHLHFTRTEEVPVTTLDALVAAHGMPAFVKVDVEGHESQVFAGLSQPLRVVSFEFNRLLLHDTVRSLQLLSALGPAEVNFLRYEVMRLALGEWLSIPDFLSRIDRLIPEEMLTGEVVVRFCLTWSKGPEACLAGK